MSIMDGKLDQKLTRALPRRNVREWATFDDTGTIYHKASCRRCGEKVEGVNTLHPVVLFREKHSDCSGDNIVY